MKSLAAVAYPPMTQDLSDLSDLSDLADNQPVLGTDIATAGEDDDGGVELMVLGIAQDAGIPQVGCHRPCCQNHWEQKSSGALVTCLGVTDSRHRQQILFDCTPDFPRQWGMLNQAYPATPATPLSIGIDSPLEDASSLSNRITGIFLTHAHIGHYTGLMYLGKEGMGAGGLPVYVMPLMNQFLRTNGPWDQLVRLGNIELTPMTADHAVPWNRLKITPFLVPHRNEYSETVGFLIAGPRRTAAFIPDIDRWDDWERDLPDVLSLVDIAFLDGTFFADGELPGRDMSEIPHPMITDTLQRLKPLALSERSKVHFIHLNHTNPCLNSNSAASALVRSQGMQIAVEGSRFAL